MALGKHAEEIAERILENEERRALWYSYGIEAEQEKEARYNTNEPNRHLQKHPM